MNDNLVSQNGSVSLNLARIIWVVGPSDHTVRPHDPKVPSSWPKDVPFPYPDSPLNPHKKSPPDGPAAS